MSRREITAEAEAKFFDGVRHAAEFFMEKADVQRALEILAHRLEQLEIPYAIVGAMAMNEYGDRRVTEVVDVLLTRAAAASATPKTGCRSTLWSPAITRETVVLSLWCSPIQLTMRAAARAFGCYPSRSSSSSNSHQE